MCDPEIMIRKWTCGNKNVDHCIKEFQLRTTRFENAIEWIPFDKLSITDKIGEGGFGCVYSATWSDGIRKIVKTDDHYYVRSREPSSAVALKTLSDYSLKEIKTNEYMMVFQYANSGNLYKFLRSNFRDLNWHAKLKLLHDISGDLYQIHITGYIHADFHSGNILQHKGISENMESNISDMGLSKKANENDSKGYIMSEMSTGQRPFDGYQFNEELAVKICIGLRPEFAQGTPECYIKLAKQCMEPDPKKRPNARQVSYELRK
ncbi:kinase-like domain-containing protein [Gigaspora rosea]|uniref:Kinase-like domain-containing protein n=1 Tax=Gigaspora rosea TaxID=44941 RepID=A0A397VR92_9GLOM|nr:kinase-like domain-containing protein [Gigaspora rosea]